MNRKQTGRVAPVPEHLALIPDGNRRWSSSHRLKILSGYREGYDKFMDFSEWANSFGVKTLSVWALSTENIKNRSKYELSILYKLFMDFAKDPKTLDKLERNGTKVRIIGNLKLLPKRVKDSLQSLERKTSAYKNMTINMLIGYGGKDDMLYAFNRVCSHALKGKISNITENTIRESMRTADVSDVDFIIRTSGEMRLSGFLPWQSDYSELYFADKYWPDFNKKDLEKALRVFSERQRRFGR